MSTNVFSEAPSASAVNWSGYHLRSILATANLRAAPGATNFAVTFGTDSTCVSLNIDSAWLGEQGVTQTYNFDGSQVQLTFNGSTSKNGIGASATIQSDFVPFAYNPAKPLVISMHISGTTAIPCGAQSAADSLAYKLEADTQTGATAPTGTFTQGSFEYGVIAVDCINLVLQSQACL
jgi:hypothetical protein